MNEIGGNVSLPPVQDKHCVQVSRYNTFRGEEEEPMLDKLDMFGTRDGNQAMGNLGKTRGRHGITPIRSLTPDDRKLAI